MPTFIAKLGSKYVEWSTICDGPISNPMTRDEMLEHLVVKYGTLERVASKCRLDRCDANGTSLHGGHSAEDEVMPNRAGPGEAEIPFAELVEWAENFGKE